MARNRECDDPNAPCCNSYVINVSMHNISKSDALSVTEEIRALVKNRTIANLEITTAHVKSIRNG